MQLELKVCINSLMAHKLLMCLTVSWAHLHLSIYLYFNKWEWVNCTFQEEVDFAGLDC